MSSKKLPQTVFFAAAELLPIILPGPQPSLRALGVKGTKIFSPRPSAPSGPRPAAAKIFSPALDTLRPFGLAALAGSMLGRVFQFEGLLSKTSANAASKFRTIVGRPAGGWIELASAAFAARGGLGFSLLKTLANTAPPQPWA